MLIGDAGPFGSLGVRGRCLCVTRDDGVFSDTHMCEVQLVLKAVAGPSSGLDCHRADSCCGSALETSMSA